MQEKPRNSSHSIHYKQFPDCILFPVDFQKSTSFHLYSHNPLFNVRGRFCDVKRLDFKLKKSGHRNFKYMNNTNSNTFLYCFWTFSRYFIGQKNADRRVDKRELQWGQVTVGLEPGSS